MAKQIIVETCAECPHIEYNDGGGHCSEFIKCYKYNIMLVDWDGDEDFDYRDKIHPECRLEPYYGPAC